MVKKTVKKMRITKKNKKSPFGQLNPYRVKPEPFPRVLYTRCKYTDDKILTSVAGVPTAVTNTYRINSIYDPDFTGTGRTVASWANLDAIYRKYIVTNAKVIVRYFDPSADNIRCGIRLRIGEQSASGTVGQTTQQLSEQPMTYMRGLANSGSQKSNFVFNIKPWTLIGLSKLEYFCNLTRYQALMAGSPADAALIDVFAVSSTGAQVGVSYIIKIEYEIQLSNRKYQASTGF